jgi:hypothetical protein
MALIKRQNHSSASLVNPKAFENMVFARIQSIIFLGIVLCSGTEAYVTPSTGDKNELLFHRGHNLDRSLFRGGSTLEVQVQNIPFRRNIARHTNHPPCGMQATQVIWLKDQPYTSTAPFITKYRKPRNSDGVMKNASLSKVDFVVPIIYLCCAFVNTLPVILIPAIVHQDHHLSKMAMTSFCGTIASVAMIGGGIGKFINGIVCQRMGGVATASNYMAGLSLCTLILSFSKSLSSVKWILAGSEFFFSAMWVASSLILSIQHSKEPIKFARGVTYLSLASITGQLLAKTLGSALLQFTDWRQVAKASAFVTLLGSFLVRFSLSDLSEMPPSSKNLQHQDESTLDKIKSILGSKIFWVVGLSHVAGFTGKTCDRILGPFLQHITEFPYHICGGLTASITLGLAYGVSKGHLFYTLGSIPEKESALKRSYSLASLSFLGLALCASNLFRSFSPYLLAFLTLVCSGIGSSSIAFQASIRESC